MQLATPRASRPRVSFRLDGALWSGSFSRSGRRSIYGTGVAALSLDYQAVLASLDRPVDPVVVGAALLTALGDRYAAELEASALHEFEQAGATYLFDLASAADLPQEDRTVAAWALTPAAVTTRDTSYQRGFPLAPRADEAPVDRGHVIPHLSGGEFGPNIFRQDRALKPRLVGRRQAVPRARARGGSHAWNIVRRAPHLHRRLPAPVRA